MSAARSFSRRAFARHAMFGRRPRRGSSVCGQSVGSCRKTANAIGVSVVTHVSTPATPTVPRTQKQNAVYHGRLREMAQLQKHGIEREDLWHEERKLKKWALAQASIQVGREISSSVDLSELEMERLLDWLADRIDDLKQAARRP